MALAAAVGFFLTTVVLSPEKLAPLLGVKETGVNEAFEQMNNQNVLIGLIIGLVAAYTYNRFSKKNYQQRYRSLVVNVWYLF
ncbi:phosphotransferase system glucose/maltose/N-acetylglucosamine-specific IIC component [Staphylococcus cohnii]